MTTFEEMRVGDLSRSLIVTKGFPTQRALSEGEVRVMSVAALRSAAAPKYFADHEDIADLGLQLAQPGDVLVAIEGGTVGETLVVSDGIEPFVPSQQAATFRVVDTDKLDPWYLGAWLATEPTREQLRRLARGAGIQRIPIKEMRSLILRVPSLDDQRQIGERFRAFETAVQSHRAVTACLEDLRNADLVVTFTHIDSNKTAKKERQR
jgi:hypothetical protein